MKVAQKKWENLRDYIKSLARKRTEQRPTSGRASVDTEPHYKYWKNLKFLLDMIGRLGMHGSVHGMRSRITDKGKRLHSQ